MVSIIFTQQALDSGGVTIPGWAIGLISLAVVLAIVPWGSWVTYTIFTMKSDIIVSNTNDKNIFEKLNALTETMDKNHSEIKKEVKDIHTMINKLMMREFRRATGRDHDGDIEKDE